MTLSPFEVERREFGRSAMGYKRSEVDEFLGEVRETVVTLWQERNDLREENERLGERVARYTSLEEQLKNTLLLAQDSAEKAQEQARRESELLMREAGQKAREIVHAAHEERQRLEVALRELQSAEQETRQRFRQLAQTVVAHLDDSDVAVTESGTTLRAVVHGSARRDAEQRSRQQQAQPRPRQGERPAPAQGSRPTAGGIIDAPPTFDPTRFAARGESTSGDIETTPANAPAPAGS